LQQHSLLAKNPHCFPLLGSVEEQDFLGQSLNFVFPGFHFSLALNVFQVNTGEFKANHLKKHTYLT
jgi:hypothetical protein